MPPVKPGGPDDSRAMFPLHEVVLGALVPSLLFSIAIGVALPLIPTSATRLGADLAMAGFVAALLPIGKVVADIPAGALAVRIGDQRAMVAAAVLALAALAGAAAASVLWVLQVSVLALGVATSVFHLTRHAYLTEITPAHQRARVLSTLGGMQRIGYFLGPLLGAVVIVSTSLRPAYWLGTGCAAITLALLLFARRRAADSHPEPAAAHPPLLLLLRRNAGLFATLGMATLLVGAVRGARQTVLPLWGTHLGLAPEVISLIFALSSAIDMLLFYPAGKVMDHHGRLWIATPSMLLMGLAMALLPLTDSVLTMSVVAALLGLGNGLGAGIIMTIGADVAPVEGRAAFFGVWRLFQDTGDAAGPLVIAVGTALGSLAVGIWVAASLGAASSVALERWLPRFSRHANRRTRRRAGIF